MTFGATSTAAPGEVIALTFTVASSDATRTYGGLNVATSGGTLSAGADTRLSGTEITHSAKKAFSSGSYTFDFIWTAPTSEGTYTIYGAGNAVNNNGATSGDGWNKTTTTITVTGAVVDSDGDGFPSDADCDDTDPAISPDATDTWYDGIDQDCDGGSDYDQDRDGQDSDSFGGTDCDDTDPAVSLAATETWYDGIDQDCDGGSDYDQDADNYDSSTYGGTDCNDTNASVSPVANETWYDGVDQDCDGNDLDRDSDGYLLATDCNDNDAAVHPDATEIWYDGVDQDCSGTSDYDQDGDGYTRTASGGTDCDDTSASISPGASEQCNGTDDNCSGTADESIVYSTWYRDADVDGYGGSTTSTSACSQPTGYVASSTDCDDADLQIHPGATDIPDDGLDQDCDGADATSGDDSDADGYDTLSDCDDTDVTVYPGAPDPWYDGLDSDCAGDSDYDADADGVDAATYGGLDCDDADPQIHPGATDIPDDGLDQDCDGADATSGTGDDADGDGFDALSDCDDADPQVHPEASETWYDGLDSDCDGASDYDADADGDDDALYGGLDCDDTTASISPSSAEICDPLDTDEDCDELADDVDPSVADAVTWFLDADGDSYGDSRTTLVACDTPSRYVGEATDCDDLDATVNPGADERCEPAGTDEDCDGLADDADPSRIDPATWYADTDGDGYGDAATTSLACAAPEGTVADATDCDDQATDVHPGAEEPCDDPTDRNCDGQVAYADLDGDGAPACEDCDDADGTALPGATERCDGVDNDCDGATDDDAEDVTTFYADRDGDGYGDDASTAAACDAPADSDAIGGDCDDADGEVSPAAEEQCNAGLDDDCDPDTTEADCLGEGDSAVLDSAALDSAALDAKLVPPPFCGCGSGSGAPASVLLLAMLARRRRGGRC